MTIKDALSTVQLNNGISMPLLGFGVFQSSPKETITSVGAAIDAGYRLIDTAAVYANEREVGTAIQNAAVQRSELFVTTKLWISDYGYDATLRAFDLSLNKLKLDYVDMYLLHFPVPNDFESTVQAYKAAESLLKSGRTRAIGVSNFTPEHLDHLIAAVSVVPAVNQIELHPFFIEAEARARHKDLGIVTQAWSPLGGVNIYDATEPGLQRHVLKEALLSKIGTKHGKSPAQVVLRWHLQHGTAIIPKSVTPERIQQNSDIFDFSLSSEEMDSIDKLNTGKRGGHDPDIVDRIYFPNVVAD